MFLAHLLDVLAAVPADIPNPPPVAPPGFEGPMGVVIGWAKWIGLGLAVLGIVTIAILIMFNSRRGEGMRELGGLGYVLVAVVLISAGTSLVSFILDASQT